jgi:two-component sensor histidine kinase
LNSKLMVILSLFDSQAHFFDADDVDELLADLEEHTMALRKRIEDLYFTFFESSSFESCIHQ